MAKVELGVPTADQPIPMFVISTADGTVPIQSPVIVDTPGFQVALDQDGRLVHNGVVVSGSLAVDVWYTPFITYDGHLRVRREDGQLEPYTGPDLLLEEPPPVVQLCGRQESGDQDSTCVLPAHSGVAHTTADGRIWNEVPEAPTHGCTAALIIRGEHFPCDWPAGPDGTHKGWNHTNKAAEAVWSN